ncbi:HDOD domain-containing protein [Geobacter sulfurreducens]|uniref:Metal-dependent phosphohydrolase, HDOD domain-containing n=1 Tax=Geobacter sulfurreducens (strain ATCC 51573 / DSM 12127 / PCA) TaxID=243231 RepID=Q74BH8_GEOSL|nr:HDOD domain-containing protein [Geobacter sulfurreducens]AAR35439.1 metal-dependent phosphohydrolase, HDOD domain-containing [Geobacter sulfurreducens PCA]ADI84896.1 metal-dependent phosphohydrolase, HDOD domain-containing [Geobacter sulfurreducens KN400]AJY71824.1 HD family phosphohydrolase [Geobacter sulfurreducens]QVW34002.1 HDOD domain-containing protein [Geobacter sulfurreducens]UAC02791.1 HDOD domain-containing protein [Geobacter sulfurreducens]
MNDKRTEIFEIIRDTSTLPTLPGIVTRLQALSENRKSTIQEMAQLVSSDQILSARVLRLVNSPSYGFYRVSTISNALILLGVNVIKSLALSSSIFEIMEKTIVGLWEHSLGAGVAANIIARRLKLPEVEEISTAALLHDIGKVIIKEKCPEDYARVAMLMERKGLAMLDAERELLGTDHAEVGEWLVRSWYLPDKLSEPVACHHDVARSSTHQVKTAVVHLADVLVKASGFGFSGDEYVPQIQPEAWQRLGMTEGDLVAIVEELEDRLIETKNFSLEIQAVDEI